MATSPMLVKCWFCHVVENMTFGLGWQGCVTVNKCFLCRFEVGIANALADLLPRLMPKYLGSYKVLGRLGGTWVPRAIEGQIEQVPRWCRYQRPFSRALKTRCK